MIFEEALMESGLPDIRIFAVGGAGIFIAQQVAKQELPFQIFLLDSNKSCNSPRLKGEGMVLGSSVNPTGLGAGSDADIGREFALDSKKAIVASLSGADMIFVIGGLGGGLGSGAIPVIVDLADQQSIPVITFVTTPFAFEGGRRLKNANQAMAQLRASHSALITLPHEQLLAVAGKKLPFVQAMAKSAELLASLVGRVLALCTSTGLINIDFADLCTLIKLGGDLFVGEGESSGQENAVENAILKAIDNPLLSTRSLAEHQVNGVLAYLEVGSDFNLGELNMIGEQIESVSSSQAEVIFGVAINSEWRQQVRVTLMAMGMTAKHGTDLPAPVEMNNIFSFVQPGGR